MKKKLITLVAYSMKKVPFSEINTVSMFKTLSKKEVKLRFMALSSERAGF